MFVEEGVDPEEHKLRQKAISAMQRCNGSAHQDLCVTPMHLEGKKGKKSSGEFTVQITMFTTDCTDENFCGYRRYKLHEIVTDTKLLPKLTGLARILDELRPKTIPNNVKASAVGKYLMNDSIKTNGIILPGQTELTEYVDIVAKQDKLLLEKLDYAYYLVMGVIQFIYQVHAEAAAATA